MKRNRIANSCIALMAVMLIAMFTGCPTDDNSGGGLSGAADLINITIGGEVPDNIPTAITKAEWDSATFFPTVENGKVGIVYLEDDDALEDAVFTASVSPKANHVFGKASDFTERASIEFNLSSPQTFEENENLIIRVTAENKTVKYYAIQIKKSNTNANLHSLFVAEESASVGTPAATWNATSIVAGNVSLSNTQKTDAEVEATPSVGAATVKYAKVTGAGEPTFDDDTSFTFADGDFLYIQVTAVDGITVLIYKVEVWIGRNANLADIKFGATGPNLNPPSVTSMGTGAATLAEVIAGYHVFTQKQPDAGFPVTITTEDEEATIKYVAGGASVTEAAITTAYTAGTPIPVNDKEFLYIEVTSSSGNVKKYYKIEIGHQQVATIMAGSPVIKASSEKFIDPIWDDVTEVYQITKIAPFGDTTEAYRTQGTEHPRYTTGVAKAMWDYDGMYIYVDVTDPEAPSSNLSAVSTSNAHMYDSFELFINENADAFTNTPGALNSNATNPVGFADFSGQYRVGADGYLSGHGPNALAAFTDLANASAWAKEGGGYVIIMQAPWLHKTETGLEPTDGKEIGFELQINACTGDGVRDGVMVWNNIAHSNYQTNSAYGLATLSGTPKVHAQRPQITEQPNNEFLVPGQEAELVVAANITDGGTLTYQWYSAAASGAAGTEIAGETNDTLMVGGASSTVGVTFYYVVITNTNTDATITGDTVRTTTSNYARIEVGIYTPPVADWEERITIRHTSAPVYGFSLPAGKTFGDYTKVVFEVKDDPTSLVHSGRLRAWGTYPLNSAQANLYLSETVTTAPTPWLSFADNRPGMGNGSAAGGKLLNALDDTNYATATDWTEMEIVFTARDALTEAAGIKGASGVVAFAIGFIGGGAAPTAPGLDNERSYYIRKIKLSNADGTDTVDALYPEHPLLWGGTGASAFVTQDGNDIVTRELGWKEKINNVSTSAPVYGFVLPPDATFGEYTRIRVRIETGTDGDIANRRLRAWGAFEKSDWTSSSASRDLLNKAPTDGDATAANARLLVTGAYDSLTVAANGTWIEYTLPFNLAAKDEVKAFTSGNATTKFGARNPLLLAFAPIPQGGSSGPSTWYVKGGSVFLEKVEMVDDDSDPLTPDVEQVTSSIRALRPDSPRLWGTAGAGNYATQGGSGPVTRTVIGDTF
jgi:hypothetical protein